MTYKLFLDDIRFPATADWIIARNMDDAIWYVQNHGVPDFISFDHDLADDHYIIGQAHEKTGYDFAKWFCEYIMDKGIKLPDFDYAVHSMNPVGAANIKHYMHNFLIRWRNENADA